VGHKSAWIQIRVAPEFKRRIVDACAASGRSLTEMVEIALVRQIKAQNARRRETPEARNST
jgi:hypothetical protein